MKYSEMIDKEVYAKDFLVGKVKDFDFDEEWKICHLEVELTKEAAKELLGGRTAFRNTLAVSALEKWPECCPNNRINLAVTKGQLNI